MPRRQSWCRVTVWHDRRRVRLGRLAAETGHSERTIHLLHTYELTNELAIAVLAGSAKRIHKFLSKGG